MSINMKKGLHRVYLVLSIAWMAFAVYSFDNTRASVIESIQHNYGECVRLSAHPEDPSQATYCTRDRDESLQKLNSLSTFGDWLLLMFAPPILVYLALVIVYLIGRWIIRGFTQALI